MPATTALIQDWNLAGLTEKLMCIEIYASGKCTDPAAFGANVGWKLLAQFYVDATGAVTIVAQSELASFKDPRLKHDQVAFEVVGSDVRLMATSANGYAMSYSALRGETLI